MWLKFFFSTNVVNKNCVITKASHRYWSASKMRGIADNVKCNIKVK